MAASQNGYPANDRSLIRSAPVGGSDVKVAVRKGPAGDLLLYVAGRWHREVEPLRAPDGVLDTWSYAERTIRGSSSTLSNHASGTALDFRARTHPLGKRGTFTAAQVAAIRRILHDCRGAVRWGGDYRGRPDEMHVEIVASEAACARVLAQVAGEDWFAMATVAELEAVVGRVIDQRLGSGSYDYRNHHCAPEDNAVGQVLSIRRDLHGGLDLVLAKLDELLGLVRAAGVDPAAVQQALQQAFAGGLAVTSTIAPRT